jgi:hypothetical protein
MRLRHTLPLVFLSLLFACGCASSNKGKIEGTKWVSQACTLQGKQFPPGTFRLEFGTDGRLTYGGVGKVITGTYSLGAGDNVTWNLDQELSGRKVHTEKISIQGDTLTMADQSGTVTFDRAK